MFFKKTNTLNIVFNSLGLLLYILGVILLTPLIFVVIYEEYSNNIITLDAFLIPALISFIIGFVLRTIFKKGNPTGYQSILICVLGWIVYSLIGGIVFVEGINASYIDGVFETMSGFTTTGITMFTGLDSMPKSILFWRSIIQWVGGLGILTFILAVLSLKGSEHRLFGAEGHKIISSRPKPGLMNTIKTLWLIYGGFTLLILISLNFAGVSLFNSLCHSLTTLSTGGYSTFDASIEHFRLIHHPHYIIIEYIIVIGMFLGGTNFFVHYHLLNRNFKIMKENTEFRYWIFIIFIFLFFLYIERIFNNHIFSDISIFSKKFWIVAEDNFRILIFQILSLLSTTGYGTKDINLPYFGFMSKQLILVMMFIGGCVGSTGGGFKVLRIAILHKLIKRETKKMYYPKNTINSIIVDGSIVEHEEIYRIAGLFFIWILFILIGGMVTAAFSKYNSYQSLSGMFSALGNIGPIYIPVNELSSLHPVIKIVYIIGMLAGRLEILPVLLLFKLKVWKS